MNCTLQRNSYLPTGIFGTLTSEDGRLSLATCEHSYDNRPKLPAGIYTCVRGMHLLADDQGIPRPRFEVMGVPGHTGILIHIGNTQADSKGCILVGMEKQGDAVVQSQIAFEAFMNLQTGVDSFQLTVC